MKAWNCEVYHLKDYIFLQESYLLYFPSNGQLLRLIVNIVLQFFPLLTLEISRCDNECTSCHTDQVLIHSPCLNWSHAFVVLSSLLNSFDDYDDCTIFHQLQEGGSSCLARMERGSIVHRIHKIVQIKFSSFIANWNPMLQLAYLFLPLSWVNVIHLIIFPSSHPMTVASHSLISIV